MQQISLAKVKSNFLSVVKDLGDGEEVVVLYGKQKQPIAKIMSIAPERKKRTMEETLGCLAHWGPVWIAPDDDEDFKEFYEGDIFPTPMVEVGAETLSTSQTPGK